MPQEYDSHKSEQLVSLTVTAQQRDICRAHSSGRITTIQVQTSQIIMKQFYFNARRRLQSTVKFLILLLSLLSGGGAIHAATVVDVQTLFGFFTLELFEEQAPETVARFLENVDAGVYDLTFVHWAQGGVVRGGLFKMNSCAQGPLEAAPGVSYPVEVTGLNNDFGTLAMRRHPLDAGQISNEWQLNLVSGAEDDASGSAPVVIGKIIDGRAVVEDIHALPRIALGSVLPFIPLVNYWIDYGLYNCSLINRDNFTYVVMKSRQVVNVFDPVSEQIHVQVDIGESAYLGLSFQIESLEEGTIRALPDSIVALDSGNRGVTDFDVNTGELFLPEIAVGDDVPFVDVVFKLTDPENLIFTLQSLENP
ncbi:MAG: peptidylprolyl isomerase [Gammaproteobacteria bacterium]|nr:peptidylprolyl isomerase [Pseudomonadales bacterium]